MRQDAICPYCGEIFSVRAHSKECSTAGIPDWDPQLLELVERLTNVCVKAWYAAHASPSQPAGPAPAPDTDSNSRRAADSPTDGRISDIGTLALV
jgi:hypothetical protein